MKKILAVLTAALIILLSTAVQAKTTGNLTFGLVLANTEQLDIGVDVEISPDPNKIDERVGVKLSLDFNQEKTGETDDNLKELNMGATIQGNYFCNDNLYTFLVFDYERDITWLIDDSVSVGPGIGYKASNFFVQSGVYYNNTYLKDDVCDDKTLWETSGRYQKVMGDVTLALSGKTTIDMSGDMFDDYINIVEPVATLKVKDDFSVQARHELKYNRTADERYQRMTAIELVMGF